jgi:hypothetical protein
MKKILIASFVLLSVSGAQADYNQRLSIGVGAAQLSHPSQTEFELGAEYERRVNPFLGLGATANYIFFTPGITFLGIPDVFLHPLASELLVSAAPLMEFGADVGTHVGVRLGTRIPLPLGVISFIPEASVNIISGGPHYIFGLGIAF